MEELLPLVDQLALLEPVEGTLKLRCSPRLFLEQSADREDDLLLTLFAVDGNWSRVEDDILPDERQLRPK